MVSRTPTPSPALPARCPALPPARPIGSSVSDPAQRTASYRSFERVNRSQIRDGQQRTQILGRRRCCRRLKMSAGNERKGATAPYSPRN
jgi:hypothetical protein